ncbi:MAG: D-alanyl-D-alanine carboxypeptidase [Candidatus Azotimanducaceae bacterium]|jgi:D-alanyl-D-alanine carboxypeptidase
MLTDLTQRQSELGITRAMVEACDLPFCPDAIELADAGFDMFDRPCQMTAATLVAWKSMAKAALDDGVVLEVVSAFRSSVYQCEVIKKKLDSGRCIEEILTVNAPPGYSEHHTGRALDLHAGDAEPLTDAFEETAAYSWLATHAKKFSFALSYPRDNKWGIAFEPWHWCYQEDCK